MATYAELRELMHDSTLLNRTEAAIIIAATNLLNGTSTANEINYAVSALGSSRGEAAKALGYILSESKTDTVAFIQSVTDAKLQSYVDTVVRQFATVMAAV